MRRLRPGALAAADSSDQRPLPEPLLTTATNVMGVFLDARETPQPEHLVDNSRFLTVEFPPERGRDQPQFRFLNESLIAKGQLGLLQSLD